MEKFELALIVSSSTSVCVFEQENGAVCLSLRERILGRWMESFVGLEWLECCWARSVSHK